MDGIRVLIADDHRLFRLGLSKLIHGIEGLNVVGEASTTEEALDKALGLVPDVVLMDINMPSEGGIRATEKIRSALPQTEIIILTMSGANDHLVNAVKAGASGYLLKDVSLEDLVSGVKAVARGEVIMNPALTKRILRAFTSLLSERDERVERQAYNGLSERELEVLVHVAHGESNKSIAAKLCISEKTARHHTSNIYRKLGIKHRAQAALEAVRLGLITPPPPTTRSFDPYASS